MNEPKYSIFTNSGDVRELTYDEVVNGVALAISYRLGHSEGIAVEGRVIHFAAQAAVHWLEASLIKSAEVVPS